jgi:hypothetical protein
MNAAPRLLCLLCFAPLSLVVLPACKDGRSADDPMLMNRKVEIVNEPPEGCKKVGTVHGIGRDGNEELSKQQAADAAVDEAKRLYGDAIVFTDEKGEQVAGSGGMVLQTTKTADVFQCEKKPDDKKGEPPKTDGTNAPTSEGSSTSSGGEGTTTKE